MNIALHAIHMNNIVIHARYFDNTILKMLTGLVSSILSVPFFLSKATAFFVIKGTSSIMNFANVSKSGFKSELSCNIFCDTNTIPAAA